jgi:rSAM/selenodomain-associated transferase 2
MISVVIPTLNAEEDLAATLSALVPAAVDGLVREVIVADGGSTDGTRRIVDWAGADLVASSPGRGIQLRTGASRARSPWLLFLHADTVLDDSWMREARRFMHQVDSGERALSAAAFQFRLDDRGLAPRVLETLVRWRCAVFRLPYGDQGLLIPRRLYDQAGGYKDMAIMEDVDFVRRLGRNRIALLETRATTSAGRYKKDGYLVRSVRNQFCLALYRAGLPAQTIARIYGKAPAAVAER